MAVIVIYITETNKTRTSTKDKYISDLKIHKKHNKRGCDVQLITNLVESKLWEIQNERKSRIREVCEMCRRNRSSMECNHLTMDEDHLEDHKSNIYNKFYVSDKHKVSIKLHLAFFHQNWNQLRIEVHFVFFILWAKFGNILNYLKHFYLETIALIFFRKIVTSNAVNIIKNTNEYCQKIIKKVATKWPFILLCTEKIHQIIRQ